MFFENLALTGVKQKSPIDLDTIRQYHPEVMAKYVMVCLKLGLPINWNDLKSVPSNLDFSGSGYRDHAFDPSVKNSPHNFAMALDICVSSLNAKIKANRQAVLQSQINWITAAQGIFPGAGFYPFQNTIHLDIRDDIWMKDYHGTPYWVKDPTSENPYKGFYNLNDAIRWANVVAQKGS